MVGVLLCFILVKDFIDAKVNSTSLLVQCMVKVVICQSNILKYPKYLKLKICNITKYLIKCDQS